MHNLDDGDDDDDDNCIGVVIFGLKFFLYLQEASSMLRSLIDVYVRENSHGKYIVYNNIKNRLQQFRVSGIAEVFCVGMG